MIFTIGLCLVGISGLINFLSPKLESAMSYVIAVGMGLMFGSFLIFLCSVLP